MSRIAPFLERLQRVRPLRRIFSVNTDKAEVHHTEVSTMNAPGVSGPHVASAASTRDGGLATFLPLQRRLFAIAYRMLGRALEAEDVVQDVWIRWQTTDRSVVRNPTAFLVAATTRLAINLRKSARVRREKDVGPRRPEPADVSSAPSLATDRREAVRTGVFVLLQKLSPAERAAYVLREAFEYSYQEIASLLSTTVVNARQLVNRARLHVVASRRMRVRLTDQRRLIDAFMAASITGDLTDLEGVLAADASSCMHRRRVAQRPDRRQCTTISAATC